jgi:hypothetical protein
MILQEACFHSAGHKPTSRARVTQRIRPHLLASRPDANPHEGALIDGFIAGREEQALRRRTACFLPFMGLRSLECFVAR